MNLDTQSRINVLAKMSRQREFIAWYLEQYKQLENITLDDLINHLQCDEESLFRLALSKAPDPQKPDFTVRIRKIAEYAGVNMFSLASLIRQVSNIETLRVSTNLIVELPPRTPLMAAREKNNESKTSDEDSPKI